MMSFVAPARSVFPRVVLEEYTSFWSLPCFALPIRLAAALRPPLAPPSVQLLRGVPPGWEHLTTDRILGVARPANAFSPPTCRELETQRPCRLPVDRHTQACSTSSCTRLVGSPFLRTLLGGCRHCHGAHTPRAPCLSPPFIRCAFGWLGTFGVVWLVRWLGPRCYRYRGLEPRGLAFAPMQI